jgi:transposase InsO family protein
MLGFDVSERTISRWMKRTPRDPEPAKRWLAFLRNHREAIAAMDFFTVPTVTFGLLYCFFVISHDRRRILHFNVTSHPTSPWTVQQLREAFPFGSARRFLIFDRDGKYGLEVPVAVRALKISPIRTSFESPWQNGIAERWVESCRRDLLDHVIAVNERHLKRLLSEYVHYYYHEDRTPSWIGEGNTRRQDSFGGFGSRCFSRPTRRVASSLRSGCLIQTIFSSIIPSITCSCVRAFPRRSTPVTAESNSRPSSRGGEKEPGHFRRG